MPRRRRYRKRRRFNRRSRRVFRRGLRRRRRARRISRRARRARQVWYHKFHVAHFTVQTAADGTVAPGGFALELNDLQGHATLTALFEEYSIRKIVIVNVPTQTTSSQGVGNTHPRGYYYYTINRFGTAPPGTLDQFITDPNVKVVPYFKTVKVAFIPNVLSNVFLGAGTRDYALQYRPWLRTETTTVPHYGVTSAFRYGPGTTNIYEQYIYAYVAFRNPKSVAA